MMKIDVPHIISTKKQMEWSNNKWTHVLIVKTDLALDNESEDYNAGDLQLLLKNISTALKSRKTGFDKIKLEEI
ncbi:hypothetical protein [Curvivirga aplysinae]|uniref:hypothetical protein n=1 Tax=Curvivirga aplysinae TaxID=2529852 RepID=UPI0012BD505A|nr:hypothetical protein [Curvivirga aplysinae]MTI10075.1 hypothetical protein [Curvivirga aplysinae]